MNQSAPIVDIRSLDYSVNGRPVFVIYRPSHIPELESFVEMFSGEVGRLGVAAPYLIAINNHKPSIDYRKMGFQTEMQFEPALCALPEYMSDELSLSKFRRNIRLGVPQEERGPQAPCAARCADASGDELAEVAARGIRPRDDRLVLLRDAQGIAQGIREARRALPDLGDVEAGEECDRLLSAHPCLPRRGYVEPPHVAREVHGRAVAALPHLVPRVPAGLQGDHKRVEPAGIGER